MNTKVGEIRIKDWDNDEKIELINCTTETVIQYKDFVTLVLPDIYNMRGMKMPPITLNLKNSNKKPTKLIDVLARLLNQEWYSLSEFWHKRKQEAETGIAWENPLTNK